MRPKFDRYVRTGLRQEFVAEFRQRVTMLAVDQTITDCADPKDNKFLALAEVADVDLIVASDPHLTDMHPWREIPILPPSAFLVGIR